MEFRGPFPHPVVPNTVLLFPNRCYFKKVISPALGTLKFQATLVFRADRTLTHRGPATAGNQNGEGVLTLINSDLSFQMVPLPTLYDPASDYLYIKINFQKRSPLLFFNVYYPPIRNTQLDLAPFLLNSPDTLILGDSNAHHPTWDSHISQDGAGNSLFNWISSSQIDTLNDPDMHALLHHSSGSRSFADALLAPTHLAPVCEWRTLPGLCSDHLPIDINLQLAPIHQSSSSLQFQKGSLEKIHH